MNIRRINTYRDSRFSQTVLNQHGAFLIDETPCEVEVISDCEAVIRGCKTNAYPALMDEFRFYAPHITTFLTESGELLAEFPRAHVLHLAIEDIQPSQFYVDEDKIAAVGTFLHEAEDIIIQVTYHDGRFISLDGHTRLFYAIMQGWTKVRAVECAADDWIYDFAGEALQRGIAKPQDMILLSHREYTEKWDGFCNTFFAAK